MIQESQAIAEGSAKAVDYTYDKAGNRISLQHDSGEITTAYAYDSRDRCTDIDVYDNEDTEWLDLADYTWLGNAISKRQTTCDYPGGTKPTFKTQFMRDGIMRVTMVYNRYTTINQEQSGYDNLGLFQYGYDTASNAISATQIAPLGHLDVDRWYTYDTLNRLITAEYKDSQAWRWPLPLPKSTYEYDDLGNRKSHDYRYGLTPDPFAYEHDKANRMTKIDGLDQGYDLAGNQTVAYSADRGTSYIYKYDHNN
ncbi:hypothetical protein LCGC14_3096090, partial [marine sediment metagenome]